MSILFPLIADPVSSATYYEVDADGKDIEYLGAENFSIFDESTTDVVFLDSYFC